MSYLGNAPARSFISFERQVFTIVNSQTAYALSHSVTNENDIRLVVNNVVQEPGSGKAYTATGTALTLSAALTNGTDEMYCVFLGRATATSAPGAGSIGTAQLAADAVTSAKISYPLTTFSSTGIDDNADATAMTITDAEKIGIGETAPLGQLHVKTGDSGGSVNADASQLVLEGSSNAGLTILGGTGNAGRIHFGDSGDNDIGFINYAHDDNALLFGTNAAAQWSLDSSGNFLPAATDHGIYLGTTSAAASNLLNDYEEGTFTPTWSGNAAVSVASGNYGYYTKIGNVVTVHFGAVLSSSSNSYYSITNAPFQGNIPSGNAMGAAREYGHTGYMYRTNMGDNSTTITVQSYQNNAVANAYLNCSLTYRVD